MYLNPYIMPSIGLLEFKIAVLMATGYPMRIDFITQAK